MTTEYAEATQAQPVAETPETPVALDPVSSPPAGVAEATSVPEASDDSSPVAGFDVTTLPEYQEAVKAPDPEVLKEAAAPEMPGEPVEQVISRAEAQRANYTKAFMQASDQQTKTFLARDLGLSSQDFTALWDNQLGPTLRNLHQGHVALNKQAFHEAVDALPQEARDRFYAQSYKGQPEAVKGVYTAGEALERAKWEEKMSKGQLLTPAQVKKIAEAAYARGMGGEEQAGTVEGAQSGQVTGGAAAPRGFRTEGDLSRAFNTNQITRAQYEAGLKRFNGGKLPGD